MSTRWNTFWQGLRAVFGDDAYERYVAHQQAHHPDHPIASRKAFYVDEQTRRFSGVSRCC